MTQFKNVITLFPGEVRLDQLRRVLRECAPVEIDARAFPAVERSHAVVDDVIARGAVVYGINTGFGKMAQTVIPSDKLAELQKNLVLSHSVGTGAPLADSTVHLIMTLKAISLARGHSGVRPEAIHALVRLINAGVYPCIPAKGSVGASGDLAPLAHMTSLLIGVGHARVDGERVTALEGLRHAGLEPLQLGPKEGLAFLNGTQVSTALALVGLFAAEDVFASAVLAGALSLEAIKGSLAPFDSRIHAARGQPGQIDVAAAYRALLEDSPIVSSHHDCGRVQDPYSISLPAPGDGRLSRSVAPCCRESGASKRMPPRTIRSSLPTRATCCRAAISTPSRSRSQQTTLRLPSPKSVRYPNVVSPCCSIRI